MTSTVAARRRDRTPCILIMELIERGGGLARAVPERASLYARHYEQVVIFTTSFFPRMDPVVATLKERGSLDERVVVRNFFAHSSWVRRLGVPPVEALSELDPAGTVSVRQQMPGGPYFRIADRNPADRHPRAYRYFDHDGQLLMTSRTSPGKKHELTATLAGPEPRELDWGAIVAEWVDEEIAGFARPVLFSLQRGFGDPVLLASKRADRKVASLHNCHYRDPEDSSSGIRPNFRALLSRPEVVDEIVCLTEQQRRELQVDVPRAALRAIPYPGRPPREEPGPKDLLLVVLVAQLIDRKRADHAVRAFAVVLQAVPGARLEIYGEGPDRATLQALIDELGVQGSVTLMGYSLEVNRAQARAACTLMTSTFEGFARVISESMSLGTPVVAYDVRYGPRDLIRHEVDGLLVDVHEPEALAAAIVRLLSDPQLARQMGERASEVLQRFPVEDFERRWLAALAPPRPTSVEELKLFLTRSKVVRRGRKRVAAVVRRVRLGVAGRSRPRRPGGQPPAYPR